MSDTTVIGVADGVSAFVREVRAELADLPLEDVDDLTGGMEADLSELAAESGGDLIGRLGSPRLYAAELRAAAGLPERVVGKDRQRGSLGGAVARARVSWATLTRAHPWLRSATAFLVTLRPAWWLLRGYLAAWALWSMLSGGTRGIRPHSFLNIAMALAAIVISVQLGRGWLRQRAALRPLLAVANSTLVIVALVASVSVDVSYNVSDGYGTPPGMSLDGQPVSNVYVYGSDGQRISGVRLFDQEGRPLNGDPTFLDANGDPAVLDDNGSPMGVVRDSSGAPLMNVYPRGMVGSDPWQVTDSANPQANRLVWTPPMSIVPLTSSAATPSPTPTPTATPTATATAPRATAKPTATSQPARPRPSSPITR
jgi:hypothetical protein